VISQKQVSAFFAFAHHQFDFLIVYLVFNKMVERVELTGATAGIVSPWEN
jgi:hypothetical protein